MIPQPHRSCTDNSHSLHAQLLMKHQPLKITHSFLTSIVASHLSKFNSSYFATMIFSKMLPLAVLTAPTVNALPPQNTITTDTMNSASYFDKVIKIGAPISRDSDDKHAIAGAQFWGAWELFTEWVNIERGGITVGSEKWGVSVIEVEDYSNDTMANNAARELLSATNYDVDFMFAPFSSGLTEGVMDIADAANTVTMTAGSAYAYVWDGTVDYGFGMLYKAGTYYDVMQKYADSGALTVAYLCNSNSAKDTCGSVGLTDLQTEFSNVGLTLATEHFLELDPDLNTYSADLTAAVTKIGTAAVDVVVIHDYDVICEDFPDEATAMSWTPNGLFLVVCDKNTVVQEVMGSDLWHVGSYSEWDSGSAAVSGISGYSSMQFTSMFEKEFNVLPNQYAASAFAGAEILVKAIEDQAIADIANVLDGPTISARILAGSWPTLKSDTALTFSANRQAIGEFVSLQYNTAGNAAVITSSAELLYPMPSFVGREVTDEDTTGDVINNYNGDDGCDADSAMALTLTAVFCLVGGIFIGAGLFWAAMSKAQGDKSTGLAAKEGASSSSAL